MRIRGRGVGAVRQPFPHRRELVGHRHDAVQRASGDVAGAVRAPAGAVAAGVGPPGRVRPEERAEPVEVPFGKRWPHRECGRDRRWRRVVVQVFGVTHVPAGRNSCACPDDLLGMQRVEVLPHRHDGPVFVDVEPEPVAVGILRPAGVDAVPLHLDDTGGVPRDDAARDLPAPGRERGGTDLPHERELLVHAHDPVQREPAATGAFRIAPFTVRSAVDPPGGLGRTQLFQAPDAAPVEGGDEVHPGAHRSRHAPPPSVFHTDWKVSTTPSGALGSGSRVRIRRRGPRAP